MKHSGKHIRLARSIAAWAMASSASVTDSSGVAGNRTFARAIRYIQRVASAVGIEPTTYRLRVRRDGVNYFHQCLYYIETEGAGDWKRPVFLRLYNPDSA